MIITFFNSKHEVYIPEDLSIEMPWDELADLLMTFNNVPKKEDTKMYNLWSFISRNGIIHRCAEDAIELHGLVLDYDGNKTIEQAEALFRGMEYVIYTTFRHGPEQDKFRVVLPFTRPLSNADFTLKRKSMMDTLIGVDNASFSRSQVIYLHSGNDEKNAIAFRSRGQFLDPDTFESEIIIPYIPASISRSDEVDDDFKVDYRNAVIDSLMTCKGIRHMTSMSLVVILKSCGANFADYRRIVATSGASDSCIHDPKTQQETWNAVKDDVKIGKTKRDEFIAKHGGKAVNVATTKTTIEKAFGKDKKLAKMTF